MLADGPADAGAPKRSSQLEMLVSEWRPLRRPGPLLAVLCFLAGVALLAESRSALSSVTVFSSAPIIAFTARRRITMALYAFVAFLLHLTYWLAAGARHETTAEERVIVGASEVCLVISFAASWFYPYQYGDLRRTWRIDQAIGDCGLPALTTNARAQEDGATESEGDNLTS